MCLAWRVGHFVHLSLSGPTAGGSDLLLLGSNFGTYDVGSVTVGNQTCSVAQTTLYNDSSITCSLPANVGTGWTVQLTVNGVPSNLYPFAYQAPQIQTVTPTNGPTSGLRLTLQGVNFGSSSFAVNVSNCDG